MEKSIHSITDRLRLNAKLAKSSRQPVYMCLELRDRNRGSLSTDVSIVRCSEMSQEWSKGTKRRLQLEEFQHFRTW